MRGPFQRCSRSAALAVRLPPLPLVALFLRVAPSDLIGGLGSEEVRDALLVSLKTSAIAHVIILLIGTPVAYLLGTRNFRGRGLSDHSRRVAARPAACRRGIGLLAAFGRRGLLGDSLDAFGIRIPFTQTAVVLAIVSSPAPSTCARRSRPSPLSTAPSSTRREPSARARLARSGSRAAARRRRPGGRLLARVRAGARRVRRNHPLRRQLPRE